MTRSKIIFYAIGIILLGFVFLAGCSLDSNNKDMIPRLEKENINSKKIDISPLPPLKSTSIITLSPSQDGRAFSVYPNHPADYASYFASQAWTWNGQAGRVRSFMQFDLSSIPDNAIISNAVLYLYHHPEVPHSSHTQSNASYLYRVTAPWNAKTLNWNNQPPVSTSNKVFLSQAGSATQNYVRDVTEMIKDMQRYGNYGICLSLAKEAYYAQMYFASSNYPNSAYHPRLVIEYSISETYKVTGWIEDDSYFPRANLVEHDPGIVLTNYTWVKPRTYNGNDHNIMIYISRDDPYYPQNSWVLIFHGYDANGLPIIRPDIIVGLK